MNILEEANNLVHGPRQKDYGHPIDDYTKVGMHMGAILHDWAKEAGQSDSPVPVPPKLAALCMVGVKLSREVHRPKVDNRVDGAGYFEVANMIQEKIDEMAEEARSQDEICNHPCCKDGSCAEPCP